MKTILAIVILFMTPILAFSQKDKIKVKDGLITVNDVPYARIEGKGCLLGNCDEYSFMSLDGRELIVFRSESYEKPKPPQEPSKYVPQYGPKSTTEEVNYYTVIFIDSKQTCEIGGGGEKHIGQTVHENGLLNGN